MARPNLGYRDACEALGLSHTYFNYNKTLNTKMWRLINLMSPGDFVQGYLKYRDQTYYTRSRIGDYFYTFKNTTEFAKWLHQKGFYKSFQSAVNFVYTTLFQTDDITITLYSKMHKMLRLIEKERRHLLH